MSNDRMNILREEAAASTPAFSEPLHKATMVRVHSARRANLTTGDSHGRTARLQRWSIGFGALAAAAMIAIVTIKPQTPADESPAQFLTAIAEMREATASFEARIGRPITRAKEQYARLRVDAEVFGDFVVRQMDLLPQAPDAQDPPAL